jgi:hypothetical protein
MVRLTCHGLNQNAVLFKIVPSSEKVHEEFVFYLKRCSICKKPVVEIVKIDIWGNKIETVRLKTKNIPGFLRSMRVISRPDKIYCTENLFSKFYLHYNEYGIRKKCFQNLSNLSLGRIETDLYEDLRTFKKSAMFNGYDTKKVNLGR